jgi:pimeloyl-ACP methyl ester carboxylesterase
MRTMLLRLSKKLDLKNAVHIGHSTGGGEVTRYVARRGKGRVKKAVLISAVPPLFMKTERNPDGVPKEVVDGIRDGTANTVHSSTKTSPCRFTVSIGPAPKYRRASGTIGGDKE